MTKALVSAFALLAATPALAERGADGDLKVLYWQAAAVLNPYLSTGAKDIDAASMVIEPLALVANDGSLIPQLAAEIPTLENGGIAADFSHVIWKLKPDVLWSDGSPFTAEDVKFTADYCRAPDFGCAVLAEFDGIDSVEVLDPLSVKINFSYPKFVPLQAFVGGRTPILQKAQFEGCTGAAGASCSDQNFAPIGTGPFRVTNFVPGDVAQFEANPNYRDPQKPAFATVTIKGGGDAMSAARAVLETGEYDFAWNLQLDPETVKRMEAAGKGAVYASFGTMVERIELNQSNPSSSLPSEERSSAAHPHPFLTDPAVRRALSMAIDRPLMTELTYGPAGSPTCTITPVPAAYVSEDVTCLTQDIEGAKAVLEEAGWIAGADGIREKDGVRLEILFQTTVNAVRQDVQAMVKQWWSEIGVATELKTVEGSSFFGGDPGNPDSLARFMADAQMYTDAYYLPDPASFLDEFTCASIPSPESQWQGSNSLRFCDAAFDQQMAQMHQTSDPAERQRIAREMADIVAIEGHYMLPLIHRGMVSARANSLAGTVPNGWEGSLWNVADWSRAE
ncbi:peptide ABC transporter substrate-binding protein [Paracoccus marinaquae]|uniref:Peptide ABC transporter substrate-binding protein n=1 Tax=Paracoccus marinaquae TaxID=2841926 RepID=A0ABS6ANP7_9RHOB|nr:peptide ABC transporter substrate-binding protein [Paracoccus marinaquae]MBU3032220.1 peptide ABC transporter substrate-binding protein [Paracoccus marinaquae]